MNAALLAIALAASPGVPDPTPPLVRTAWYWEARGREDRAADTWREVLRAGDRADALAAVGAWHARAGRLAEARALLERLEHRWPGLPEALQLEQAIAVGPRHAALLARARDAARAGRLDDAVARYRELFGAGPPQGHLAAEYYEACAGVPASLPEALAGLETLARRVPEFPRYRLALARALTYGADTRLAGIERLETLAADPVVGGDADAALRRALGWLAPGPDADRHMARWLARHPDDHALASAQEAGKTAGAVETGWAALDRGDLTAARRAFADAGNGNARALAGLAVAALRERDYATARLLAERARDLAPSDALAWEKPLRAAVFWDLLTRGRVATAAGRYDEARAILAEAAASPGAERREVDLAITENDEARGARADAEARLRALANARPKDAGVLRRLVDLLARSGKPDEAIRENERLARLAPAQAADLRPLRAAALRARAAERKAAGDLPGAREALKAAAEAMPDDAWTVHDLAVLALDDGDAPEAARLARRALALDPDLHAARYVLARALVASGDVPAARAALDAVPATVKDASVEALRRKLDVEAGIARAQAFRGAAARDALLPLEARAGGDPDLLAALARAWRRAGDVRRAVELFRESLRRSQTPSASARLELAAALTERGGADGEVADLLQAVRDDPALTPHERAEAQDLGAGIAIRRADALREGGDPAAALAALKPALDEAPDDARLLAARGRALLASGDSARALASFRDALARDPRSIDGAEGAVAASLARGEVDDARRIAADAVARRPDDARAHVLLARAESQGGDDAAALASLRAAVRAGGGDGVPAAADVRAEADRLAARHALDAVGGIVLRARDGESGLGALTEVRTPVTSALPAGLLGRLVLGATPVRLDAGVADLSQGDLSSRFGSGASGGPYHVGAAGVELSARWEQPSLVADAGTTPLGFPLWNVTGGLRLSHDLGRLAVALAVSRRAVTESTLAYAGVRDPATGRVWGGVLRNEARGEAAWRDGTTTTWAAIALGVLDGTAVATNASAQASGGMEWPMGRALGGDARGGFTLSALGYRQNLRYFTLGQGGYFSPQLLVHAGVPLSLRGGDRVSWHASAELGYDWFRENGTGNAAAWYPGRSASGIALDLRTGLRFPMKAGLDAKVDVEAHHADQYQELLVSAGLTWRLWAPR